MEALLDLIRRYGGLAWRRRWIAAGFAWAVCLAGWVGIWMMPSQYEASARVYIDADAVLTPLLKGLAVDNAVSDETDLLQRSLLARPNLEKIIARTGLLPIGAGQADLDRLVARLASHIRIESQTRAIFLISYRDPDRHRAFDVVQAMLASFVENKDGDSRAEMAKADAFLQQQIDSYEQQLRDAEQKRAAFKAKYVDLLPGEGGTNRLEQAQASVTTLTGQLADARARKTTLTRELTTTPPLVVTETAGASGDPHAALRAAEQHLRDLQQVDTDAHPDVLAARRMVDSLRAAGPDAPAGAGGFSRSAPNPVYEQLKVRLVETDSEIDSLQRQAGDATVERDRLEAVARGAPELEAQFVNLNRDYDVIRHNYDELLGRRESMRIAAAAQVDASNVKFVVIDTPRLPRLPVAPNRLLLSAAVLFAGLAAGGGAVFGLIQIDTSFRTAQDLRALGLSVIGSISFAVEPLTWRGRLRLAAGFGGVMGLLLVLFAGLALRYAMAGGSL